MANELGFPQKKTKLNKYRKTLKKTPQKWESQAQKNLVKRDRKNPKEMQ